MSFLMIFGVYARTTVTSVVRNFIELYGARADPTVQINRSAVQFSQKHSDGGVVDALSFRFISPFIMYTRIYIMYIYIYLYLTVVPERPPRRVPGGPSCRHIQTLPRPFLHEGGGGLRPLAATPWSSPSSSSSSRIIFYYYKRLRRALHRPYIYSMKCQVELYTRALSA